MQLLRLTPEHLSTAVSFIEQQQADPTTATAYFGQTAAEIAAAIAEFTPAHNALLAYDDNQSIGFLGIDSSAEIRRTWLYGPLVEVADWADCADTLYAEAQRGGLFANVRWEQELFVDVVNTHIAAFAARHGFTAGTAEASFRLETLNLLAPTDASIIPLATDLHPAFIALHESIFPRAYFTGAEILEQLGERNQVFSATEQGELAGYIYARVEPEADNGYIDFVGVTESARRRGIGRMLTIAAARWLFTLPDVKEVTLTVNAANAGAIALYQSLGFTQTQTLQPYRKI